MLGYDQCSVFIGWLSIGSRKKKALVSTQLMDSGAAHKNIRLSTSEVWPGPTVWSGGKACRPHTLQRGEASTGSQKFSKMVPLTPCVPKNENGKSSHPPAKRAEKRSPEGVGAHCRVRVVDPTRTQYSKRVAPAGHGRGSRQALSDV